METGMTEHDVEETGDELFDPTGEETPFDAAGEEQPFDPVQEQPPADVDTDESECEEG